MYPPVYRVYVVDKIALHQEAKQLLGPLVIASWEWDEGNERELATHGLSRRIIRQVADEWPKFRKNRRGRAATHQMIGPDGGGRMWTICIKQAADHPGVWRAITGWAAEPEDRDWYGKW
jgi:hypothetical protein